MHWQDLIFTAGNIIFTLALVPTILQKEKPALSTSIINGSLLTLFVLAYFSLHLWFSGIATIFSTSAWFILAYQKYRQGK